MKTLSADVKSSIDPATGEKRADGKRVVVAQIDYVQYDSLGEAVSALGDETVLKHTNAQIETNAKNKARAAATGVESHDSLVQKALKLLFSTPEGTARLQQTAGSPAFNTLIDETIGQIKAAAAISGAPVTEASDEQLESENA
jgi:hypothetical protein